MTFDTRVEQSHKLMFSNNVELALQQLGSKLRPYVSEKPCSGEAEAASDLVQPVNYERQAGRPRSNIDNKGEFVRRWLMYRDPIATGQYLDREDRWRAAMDPSSELVRAHAAAIGRGIDDTILGIDPTGAVESGGLLGAVVEGKRPGGAGVALPSAQITVHGGAGLTIAKLRKARKRLGLDENDLDREMPVMAITANQDDDLLGIVESASANLNMLEQPHIVDGKVQRLMGFTFVRCNRLPKSGTTRSCPVWIKSKVVLGVWQDIRTDMFNDTSAANTPVIRIDAVMDATRIEDKGMHIVECTEA